jgi:energy-coupling factor transporter ATP-binding protein EcfA2
MKTRLSQFCDQFEHAVRPVLAPLSEFVEALESVGKSAAGPQVSTLPAFRDVDHQLRVLADKVAEQQAYVLIFGPLKSGKSTLMNAIGAAYVSEVTALPAYPCMVYVSHSPTREFVVTRYDGERQTFGAPASMRMQVNRDHAELADRIRAVEKQGLVFEPAEHFPEAIRRIDVKVPAQALADSGAVLVDTPGLYSKMKFGYDQMTREFRNAAASAIFVVKTDNLFLEQVFEEFQSLLDLFSRIFLVVNVDTTKQDLRPDGSLAPSLEREDPVRVIEAFETLSMSDSLKSAVDEGRLCIYPVDLLRAASARLRSGLGAGEDGQRDNYTGREDFEGFLRDLTDYLNSNEYLLAFLSDSLRHGRQLLERADDLARDESVAALARRAAQLAAERDEVTRRAIDLESLREHAWPAAFSGLGSHLVNENQASAPEMWKRAMRRIGHAVDGWFESDGSVQELLDRNVGDELAAFQREYAELAERSLRERVADATAGGLVPEELAQAAERVGVRLADFAASGLVAVLPSGAVDALSIHLDLEELPIRKGILDYLLFRRAARIRRRLVGDLREPTRRIPRGEKARRLAERGREWLHTEIHARVDGALDGVTRRIAEHLGNEYAAALCTALETELARLAQRNDARLGEILEELEELEVLSERLALLRTRVASSRDVLDGLAEIYADTEASALTEVVPMPRLVTDGDRPADVESSEGSGAHRG